MRSRLVQVLVPIAAALAVFVAVGHANAQAKPPVPVAEVQASAKKAAGELYGKQFQQAKTTAEKAALATEMIEAAMKVQGGSPDQYVLLKIAADVAAGAGDAATALQAVEKMVERFDVPAPKLCAETLLAAAGNATMTSQHKAVAEAALKIADAVADAEEYALALSLCELAKSSAHKARQGPLAKELAAKIEDFQKRQRAFQEYQAAWALMQDDPAEPAANLAAGRYLCLVKGDWKRGVPMLALGSDAALKAVALMELRGADPAEQQASIGDAWWDAAETRQGAERDTLRLRAGFWYRQAAPKLAGGLAGLKIKQRLAEVEKLGREIPDGAERAHGTKQTREAAGHGSALAAFRRSCFADDVRARHDHLQGWQSAGCRLEWRRKRRDRGRRHADPSRPSWRGAAIQRNGFCPSAHAGDSPDLRPEAILPGALGLAGRSRWKCDDLRCRCLGRIRHHALPQQRRIPFHASWRDWREATAFSRNVKLEPGTTSCASGPDRRWGFT